MFKLDQRGALDPLLIVLLAAVIALGGYAAWTIMLNKSDEPEAAETSQNEISQSSDDIATASNDTETDRTTYTSKVGGLELNIPSKYVVIVNVDGNKGGAPGSTFRIGEVESDGVVIDGVYEWVEIEIDHLSLTTDQEADGIKNELADERYTDLTIDDYTLNNMPAKVVTGSGPAYAGQRKVVVAKSGEFIYTFSLNSIDLSKTNEMFESVLNGANITEKTLE